MTLGFRHDAMLYDGVDEFIAGAGEFLEEGLRTGDSMLVLLNTSKIDLLRSVLGARANVIGFADMNLVGANPARLIPEWRRFVDDNSESGTALRGIGEPVWSERDPAEMVECGHHEELLNLAFADVSNFSLLCPYDVSALAPEIIGKIGRSHSRIRKCQDTTSSADYHPHNGREMLDAPLSPRPASHARHEFSRETLSGFRRFVAQGAIAAGFSSTPCDDLILAANEIATNSVLHGGGSGSAHLWNENGRLVIEVVDAGQITDPLIGRVRPHQGAGDGYGLWLTNQLCDLVQIRSNTDRTVVRIHQTIR